MLPPYFFITKYNPRKVETQLKAVNGKIFTALLILIKVSTF